MNFFNFSIVKNSVRDFWYKLNGRTFIHFFHIGKTGGTAFKYALKFHLNTAKFLIKLHGHQVTLKDIPVGEKVIFILRDPISRFLSGFYSRKRQGQPKYYVPWRSEEREAFETFSTPQELVTALTSTNDEIRAKAEKAMRSIQHVRNSFFEWFHSESYFQSRLSDIFFIGFQETLSQDFQILKQKLGLPPNIELPDNGINAHKNPEGINLNLNEDQRNILKEWYAKDYEFLKMTKELAKEINL